MGVRGRSCSWVTAHQIPVLGFQLSILIGHTHLYYRMVTFLQNSLPLRLTNWMMGTMNVSPASISLGITNLESALAETNIFSATQMASSFISSSISWNEVG